MDIRIPLEDVFDAYYDCRKHKRGRTGALQFAVNLEENLIALWKEVNDGTWTPQPSTVFIIKKPVVREIFAASFRDRIVHHLVIRRLNPIFEKYFIRDTYSCRVGKGTHYGIRRAQHFISSCSQNGKSSCYVLKVDLRGYFMSINRTILYNKVSDCIDAYYTEPDAPLVKKLCAAIIANDPTQHCIYRSPPADWNNLPHDKSLFHSKPDCGLPIGNLTSQIFANLYLTAFDHYVKRVCAIRHYGRYVDDCLFVHESKEELKKLIPRLRAYLSCELGLTLHPKKIYLQHHTKGVLFLGTFIKQSHTVVNHRTWNNFAGSIARYNALAANHKLDKAEQDSFLSSVNSYLGILKHFKTYHKRFSLLNTFVSSKWRRLVTICAGGKKIQVKKSFQSGKNRRMPV